MQTHACFTHLIVFFGLAFCISNLTVQVPPEYAYLLPRPFNNTFTRPFLNTTLPAGQVNNTIVTAHHASFVSYDPHFDAIIGNDPTVVELSSSNTSFAFEGGLWVPPLNQIWFTAFLDPIPGYLSILDLNTSTVFQPTPSGPAANMLQNPNGLAFNSRDGLVYMTFFGNTTTSPSIVSIKPTTYETTEIVNSFYGLPLNGPDDLTFATSRATYQQCLFFSDFYFAAEGLQGTWAGRHLGGPATTAQRRVALHSTTKTLQMAISPLDVQTPNGLAVDKDNTVLYVTGGPDPAVFDEPYNASSSSSPGIYAFDLGGEDGCTPTNKRLLGIARQGFANGIKADDQGRIWTAEYEGVVVRDANRKILGLFNAVDILQNANIMDVATIANFALARDPLVWLGFGKIYSIQLGQTVKTWY